MRTLMQAVEEILHDPDSNDEDFGPGETLHDIDPNDPDFDLEAIYSYDEEDQLLQVVFCSLTA